MSDEVASAMRLKSMTRVQVQSPPSVGVRVATRRGRGQSMHHSARGGL